MQLKTKIMKTPGGQDSLMIIVSDVGNAARVAAMFEAFAETAFEPTAPPVKVRKPRAEAPAPLIAPVLRSVLKSAGKVANGEDKPQRKRRTKAEMEAARAKSNGNAAALFSD